MTPRAAARSELNDIAFSGDVRSLADPSAATAISCSPARLSVSGVFRTDPGWHRHRVHLNIDPGQRALSADLDGVLNSSNARRASKAP